MGCGSSKSNTAVPNATRPASVAKSTSSSGASSVAAVATPAITPSVTKPAPVDLARPTSSPNMPPKFPVTDFKSNRSERSSNITIAESVVAGAGNASKEEVATALSGSSDDKGEEGGEKGTSSTSSFVKDELIAAFKSNGEDEEEPVEPKTTLQFAKDFMLALIPTPDNLADVFSDKTVDVSEEYSVTKCALATHNLTRLEHARILNRRPSATAVRCREPGCSQYHFRLGEFCPIHDETINTPMEIPVVAIPENGTSAVQSDAELKSMQNYLNIAEKRRQMMMIRDCYNVAHQEEEVIAAKTLWYNYCNVKYCKVRNTHLDFGHVPKLISNIGNNNYMPDTELVQLFFQFKRLNVTNSGTITSADLKELVAVYIDQEWVASTPADVAETTMNQWIISSKQSMCPTVSTDKITPSLTFPEYVDSLLRLRENEWESSTWDILRTGFWDLRLCVLFMPPAEFLKNLRIDEAYQNSLINSPEVNNTPCFWLYKKGDLFARRRFNAWRKRFCKPVILTNPAFEESGTGNIIKNAENTAKHAYTNLEYWDNSNITEGDTVMVDDSGGEEEENSPNAKAEKRKSVSIKVKPARCRGNIHLLDICMVNFSPRDDIQPNDKDILSLQQTIEVGVNAGRVYVLASKPDDIMKLASYCSWYEQASQVVGEWRENWGCKRKHAPKTLRDYINGGNVVCKIMEGKKHASAAEDRITKARADALLKPVKEGEQYVAKILAKIEKEKKEFEITEMDIFYLDLIGLNIDNAEASAGGILAATKALASCKHIFRSIDQRICYGLGEKIGTAIVTSILVYKYVEKFNYRRLRNKYGVLWMHDSETTCCAVCKFSFKTFTLRKNLRRHHCRMCGRVVCHPCSARLVYLEISKAYERVCTDCVNRGDAPEDVISKFEGPEAAKAAIAQQQRAAVNSTGRAMSKQFSKQIANTSMKSLSE